VQDDFRDEQRHYWEKADAAHFRWQTTAPYIARSEAALLDDLRLEAGERLLEIGCGEGGNLHHVAARHPTAKLYGTDFSPAKAAFAHRATGALTACADATALPLADAAFDAVLIRDLLHHVLPALRGRVLTEARRVLRPGGRLFLIEPNGRSPLVLLQACTVRAERGALASTRARLEAELEAAGLVDVTIGARQPLPLSRVLLHPQMGAPGLGGLTPVAWALERIERAADVLPTVLWTYLVCQGRRPDVQET
jgi:SAM-dependent methyltransferase